MLIKCPECELQVSDKAATCLIVVTRCSQLQNQENLVSQTNEGASPMALVKSVK